MVEFNIEFKSSHSLNNHLQKLASSNYKDNVHLFILFKAFLYNTNNFHTIICFQLTIPIYNKNNIYNTIKINMCMI